MKDKHGNKITEQEFTKDIGHRTEEMFEEIKSVAWKYVVRSSREEQGSRKEMENILDTLLIKLTKQIQSELLKEVLELTEGTEDELVYCIKQLDGDDIRKLADEKGIILN